MKTLCIKKVKKHFKNQKEYKCGNNHVFKII